VSTTSRILLAFLALLALGIFVVQGRITLRLQRQYSEAVEEPMVDMARLFAALLEQQLGADGTLDVELIRRTWRAAAERTFRAQIYDMTKTRVDAHLYVTDRHGVVLFDSDGGRAEGRNYRHFRDVSLTLGGGYGARTTRVDPAREISSIMFVAAPITRDGGIIGVASVSKPVASVLPFREQTQRWIRNVSLGLLIAVTAAAYFIVTHFSRPIRRLTAYAQAVARGERVAPPTGGAPEIATLRRAFEEMRRALDGRGYVENYVQTLTHEMKSPVAAIRGAAELLREESMPAERRGKFLGNIEAEADRLQAGIDRLLALAALENRQTLDAPEPVPLAPLAAAVCAQFQPAAEARGVKLELTGNAAPTVCGESFLLEIALNNLLQNAIDFSPSGGCVTVRVACAGEPPWAEVSVEDEGAGIPDYALPRIFERFYSLQHPATGRKSSGLGLCFVREAVELHGGRAVVANRTDGRGARAVMALPVSERLVAE
jgi:two-component system sensor histidine kinase CreC